MATPTDRILALTNDVHPPTPLRQLDLAAGIRPGSLVKMRAGDWPRLGGDVVVALSGLFGVTTDHLLKGTGRKPAREHVRAAVDRALRAYERTVAQAR